MPVQTHLKTTVPVGRRSEAQGYFLQLVPGRQPGWTERLETGIATMEVAVDGDWVTMLEAALDGIDTKGIEFEVYRTPA